MCWCIKVTCPLLLNLTNRIMTEIVDFITRTMNQDLQTINIFEDKPACTTLDTSTDITDEKHIKKPPIAKNPICTQPVIGKKPVKPTISECQTPFETLHKWNESLKRNNVKMKKPTSKINMSDRPLPVPVENEFYYMEISRHEAESLLMDQPDGTFILRPSSQENHAYTITLTYQGIIYNIGCRKRHDGHLALGFSKPTEPHFQTIHELIEFYYNEKLILLVDGVTVGSTALKRLHP